MTMLPARPMVSAAVIERFDNHVLIVKPQAPVGEPALWQFPRGPVRPGESPERAMRRIAQEQLGLAVEIVIGQPPFLAEIDQRETEVRFFICGLFDLAEVTGPYAETRWIPRIHLREYDLDNVSQPVAEWLLDG